MMYMYKYLQIYNVKALTMPIGFPYSYQEQIAKEM